MYELQHLLRGWEFMGEPRRQMFVDVFTRYLHFYRKHMALEETAILPAARTGLQHPMARGFDALRQQQIC